MQETDIFDLEKAAIGGDPKAQYALGIACMNEQNDIAAVYWLKHAAENGNAQAQFRLGEIEKDPKKAKKYFIAAALQNHPDAVRWIEENADQNDIDILNCRGLIACNKKTEEDYRLAFGWFEQTANRSDLLGLYHMAKLRFYGVGVEKNTQIAANLFQLAANNTHRRKDFTFKRAARWFKEISNLEDPDVLYQLGLWCYHGKCVKQNHKRAYKYFMGSARKGNSDAQCFIEMMSTQKNQWSNLSWLLLSAKQKNLRAYYVLGRVCFEQKQFSAALSWFDKIVKEGGSPFHFVGAEETGEELSEDFSLTEFLIAHEFDVTVEGGPYGKIPFRLALDRVDINRANLFRDELMFNIFCRKSTYAKMSLKESLKNSVFEQVHRGVILGMLKFLSSQADLLSVSLINRFFWQLAYDNATPLGAKYTQRTLDTVLFWKSRHPTKTAPSSETSSLFALPTPKT